MTVELDKKDLLTLLFGTTPDFNIMDEIPEKLGHYVGGFVDDWSWNKSYSCMVSKEIFEKEYGEFTEEYLWSLYQKCKPQFIK